MKNEFIPYEEALALKELGFDAACSAFYKLGDSELYYDTILQSQKVKFRNNTELNAYGDLKEKISAPLYQQAFRWFRKEHQLESVIHPEIDADGKPSNYHWCIYLQCNSLDVKIPTHREGELACLRKLIEIVKEKL